MRKSEKGFYELYQILEFLYILAITLIYKIYLDTIIEIHGIWEVFL